LNNNESPLRPRRACVGWFGMAMYIKVTSARVTVAEVRSRLWPHRLTQRRAHDPEYGGPEQLRGNCLLKLPPPRLDAARDAAAGERGGGVLGPAAAVGEGLSSVCHGARGVGCGEGRRRRQRGSERAGSMSPVAKTRSTAFDVVSKCICPHHWRRTSAALCCWPP
jgi:hypothetical protein